MLICLAVPGIVTLVLALWSALVGVSAWRAAARATGEAASALQLIGLCLCEPLASTLLVGFALLVGVVSAPDNPSPAIALATAPMVVQLLPASGLQMSGRLGAICRRLMLLGLARWLVSAVSLGGLAVVFAAEGLSAALLGVALIGVLPLAAVALMAYTAAWGSRQIAVARGQATSAARVVGASARPLPSVEVPCPQCWRPGALALQSCPHCGLIYAGRIPEELRDVPRYTVVRPLGAGGMAHVFLARDRAIEQWAVLKCAPPELGEDARRCLAHEAVLLRDLQHPGVAQWLGWYPEAATPFLAIEFVAGESLEQRLRRGPLPLGQALQLGAAAAEALAYLAGQRHPLAHGDVKPANLVLGAGDRPVLLDFGSARLLDQPGAHAGAGYGTPGYAAPEQYRGAAGARSDSYGLAATLYHALTGDDPTEHPLAFPALAQLPRDVAAVLGAALERDPEQRSTPSALRAQLRRLAEAYRGR